MSVSQRTAIDDGNAPGSRLVEDVVRPQVQENVASLKEGFLQIEQLLVDGKRPGSCWLYEREEGEQILADANGHASETGFDLSHKGNARGPFLDHDPIRLSQGFPIVGVVINPLRVAHNGHDGRDGMSHLLVRLEDTVRS